MDKARTSERHIVAGNMNTPFFDIFLLHDDAMVMRGNGSTDERQHGMFTTILLH